MATQAASFDPLRMGFILGRDRVTAGDHTLQRQAELPPWQEGTRKKAYSVLVRVNLERSFGEATEPGILKRECPDCR